jgi:hypothetical protein
VAYPALLIGFPIWSWGRGASRQWTNAAKTDDQVSAEFKGLNTKYTLFHHVVLDKLVLDHVLISPDGVLVMEIKEGGGLVTCTTTDKGDRWGIKLGILERIARIGEGGLGNPTTTLDSKIAALRDWLTAQGATRSALPVTGVVVFRNPLTPLSITSSKYDVLRLTELKEYVQQGPPDEKRVVLLPTDDRNRVIAALRGLIPEPTEKEKAKAAAAVKRPETATAPASGAKRPATSTTSRPLTPPRTKVGK